MVDLDYVFGVLLALAQLALPVIAIDAVLAYYTDISLLMGPTSILRQVTFFGGMIGVVDQLDWLVTERIPDLMDKAPW